MPATDQSVSLQLRLDVPANADLAHQDPHREGRRAGQHHVSLPITITLAKELPAKLAITPQLPALRGTPKSSFDYQLTIKNDSGRNLTVSFAATRRAISRPPSPRPTAPRSSPRCRSTPAPRRT